MRRHEYLTRQTGENQGNRTVFEKKVFLAFGTRLAIQDVRHLIRMLSFSLPFGLHLVALGTMVL